MKKAVLTLFIALFCFGITHAQVGINTSTPNAQLDIKSSNQATPSNTDGLLIPKVDAFPVINPTAAQKGMLVYLNAVSGSNQPGFYYWNNPGWIGIVTGTAGGTLDQAYDFGGVGLGKTITADSGAVLINGTDGLVSTGTSGSGAIAPAGAGTRMVWNPRKVAFRAGNISGTEWDDVNVGLFSVAFGIGTRASGGTSTAFGRSTVASADESTAFGFGSVASAQRSTAFGILTTASGDSSTAFGGSSLASGPFSTAFGGSSLASASFSTAFGRDAIASGDVSTAFGNSTDAIGSKSTAFGEFSLASGGNSTAFGLVCQANGESSTAFGRSTIANGQNSTSFGRDNTASSYGETALGIGATTYVPSINGATQFRTANATDRLLLVGNAVDANNNNLVDAAERSDALVILKNGNTGIGSSTPQDKLHVVGNIRMVDGNQATGRILVSDANGTATWTTTSTIASGTLDQAYDFGGAGVGRTITADAGAVTINGNDGLVANGTFGSGALAPTGAGTKMFWNPRKGAFRAGNVLGAQWDDANVGAMSTAFGSGRAGGSSSTAFGSGTFASGLSSTAFGGSTVASGDFSTAFGNNTISSGTLSTATGYFNTAPSFAETVLGIGATVYTPTINGNINFGTANATDRLLVVGNASDANSDGAVDVAERSDAFVILKNGNTGIGISTPQRKLHVATGLSGVTPFAGAPLVVESSGDAYQHFLTPNTLAATGAGLLFGTPAGVIRGGIIYSPLAEKLDFRTGGNTVRMTLTNAGNLGIGTPTPLDKLHVVGNIRMVDGNEAAGNILVSDANGTATWTTTATIASGTLDQAYDFGGAGLGKTITADAGAVLINGTDGLVSTGTKGSGVVMPTGGGTRMVWNPRKGAFRAGSTFGTMWDDANVGFDSTALGNNNIASGNTSTAFGESNDASGDFSTAFGFSTIASGDFSTAFGNFADAIGNGSTAFGSSDANGGGSTAFGNDTNADGITSTTFGKQNTASSFGETTFGIGATTYTTSTNGAIQFRTANATDRLLVVGNAIDADNDGNVDVGERSDALVILKNGNTGIGISTPQRKLHVATGLSGVTPFAGAPFVLESSGDAYQHFLTPNTLAATGAGLLFGTPAGAIRGGIVYSPLAEKLDFRTGGNTVRMTLTNAGDVGIGTPTPGGQLELSLNEGRKPGTNTWTIVSDQRLKYVNGNYTKGLNEILQLKPIRFNYKNNGSRTFEKEVLDTEFAGFLAQEVQPLFPEAVGTDDDGFLNFNIHPILIASMNAFKELDAKNEQLEQKSSQLEKENQLLKESVQAINDKILLIIAEMEKLKK